jgi:hypothetical protein
MGLENHEELSATSVLPAPDLHHKSVITREPLCRPLGQRDLAT